MLNEASRLLIELGYSVTQQQKQIIASVIDSSNKITVVSAGAGSGKTHVSVGALLALLKGRKVMVDEIVLITFTNEAANNLRSRLAQEFDKQLTQACEAGDITAVEFWLEQQERVANTYIGTIHSFCSRILKEFGFDLEVSNNAEINVSTADRKEAIKAAIDTHLAGSTPHFLPEGSKLKDYETVNLIDSVIEYYGNLGFDSASVLKSTQGQSSNDQYHINRVATAQLIDSALENYRSIKREKGCLDSHDLISKMVLLIKSDQKIKTRLGERYRYLFIDEFQDTDQQQIEIAQELKDVLKHILLVGDSKQAIYGFRGATSDSIGSFAHKNGVPILNLNMSGRASESLLGAQNALFKSIEAANPLRFKGISQPLESADYPRDMNTLFKGKSSLVHIEADDSESATADAIQRLVGQKYLATKAGGEDLTDEPITNDDIVVLVRTNEQAKSMYAYLSSQDFEVSLSSGESIFAKKEITDTLKVLECTFSYPDCASMLNVMTTSYWVNQESSVDTDFSLSLNSNSTEREIKGLFEQSEVGSIVKELSEKSKYLSVVQLIESLYKQFKVRERCRAKGDAQAVFNLDYLLSFANNLTMDSNSLSLPLFIDILVNKVLSGAEVKDLPQGLDPEARGKIRIMTVHRSKGDEFKFVIIPYMERNANTGTIPRFIVDKQHGLDINLFEAYSKTESGDRQATYSTDFWELAALHTGDLLPEEIRNFYVAVTRAELQLLLICGDDSELKVSAGDNYYAWQTAYEEACQAADKSGHGLIGEHHSQLIFRDGKLSKK
ncbi:DNA helicase-2/ATP-dependent DNA helicase PcrA [Vibrio crassostreae]|uniref:UvrD-helicase domain-containing protein n=1 Tax=Vibrio crassostreae TaxID=246167 RepID=UPI000F4FB20D|nr:ATP-dependent helicase [Vibrio crassostreae]RPF10203.1 DNA helicase-2/ATP-dependent DNA helicase PcrA [Vibrio crassostreae]